MKKTFQLEHPKIKPARLIEAVRRDVKKYIKREKRKSLPEGVDIGILIASTVPLRLKLKLF